MCSGLLSVRFLIMCFNTTSSVCPIAHPIKKHTNIICAYFLPSTGVTLGFVKHVAHRSWSPTPHTPQGENTDACMYTQGNVYTGQILSDDWRHNQEGFVVTCFDQLHRQSHGNQSHVDQVLCTPGNNSNKIMTSALLD